MKPAAVLLSALVSSNLGAAELQAPLFHNAGVAIYTNSRDFVLREQNAACQQFEDAGDSATAQRCYRHISAVDSFLVAAAADGPFPYLAWVYCTEPLHDDIDMGARCLIGTQHVCGFTAAGEFATLRCIELIQSGAVYLNPVARSYDFDGRRR